MRPDTNACAVEADRLVYRFPDGRLALDNVSTKIASGEQLGILGPSVAGKFLQHLNGVLLRASGLVRIGGEPVVKANLMAQPPPVSGRPA